MGGKGSGGGSSGFVIRGAGGQVYGGDNARAKGQNSGKRFSSGDHLPFGGGPAHWKPIGYDTGKGPIDRSHLHTQGATGERSQDVPRGSGRGGGMRGGELAAKAVGTIFGTAAGAIIGGTPGAAYGGVKGYGSAREGWIGDAFNARPGEAYRDYLEREGFSRKDVQLLGRKPGALSRAARDQGYTGTSVLDTSDWDEGEDYDSITGEIL